MKHQFFSSRILTASILLFGVACSNPSTESEGEPDTQAARSPAGCVPASEPKVLSRFDTLNILVETSGSMAGFMPTQGSQTQFQQQLDDLLANAESEDVATLQLLSAGREVKPLSAQQFRKMLRQGLQQTTASTALPNLLRQVAGEYTGPNQVSLFISDFIYAPPNAADRDYINNDIRRALARVSRNNLAVAVYAFQSEFNGTFYPAGSKSGGSGEPLRNCCETPLPYYIWAIGPESALRRVHHQLLPEAEQVIEFGFARRQPAYQVLPGGGRRGSWYLQDPQQPTLTLDNPREISQGDMVFTLGLKLNDLPQQWRSTDYLQAYLGVDSNNGTAELVSVRTRAELEEAERLTARDRELLSCYSHFVTVKVNSIDNRSQPIELSLQLPARMAAWAGEWTTEDDRRPEESGAKTFALTDMLEGVQTLYRQEKQDVFSLPVTIQKAN